MNSPAMKFPTSKCRKIRSSCPNLGGPAFASARHSPAAPDRRQFRDHGHRFLSATFSRPTFSSTSAAWSAITPTTSIPIPTPGPSSFSSTTISTKDISTAPSPFTTAIRNGRPASNPTTSFFTKTTATSSPPTPITATIPSIPARQALSPLPAHVLTSSNPPSSRISSTSATGPSTPACAGTTTNSCSIKTPSALVFPCRIIFPQPI